MPPRHGKSSLVSEWFPFWYLGWRPRHRVILTSYEADYAEGWGQRVRDHLNEHGQALFGSRVSSTSSARGRWDVKPDLAVTTGGIDRWSGGLDDASVGGMNAAGAGGPITGKGANLLVIDDPIKNDADARSKHMRDSQWEWLQATALTRLEPHGVVVLIMTHWNLDDMAGRIQAGELGGEPWTVLKMPAVATVDEPMWPLGIGRKPGEALWPERYDGAALAEIKARLNTYWWASLYQQSPIPDGGAVFKAEWFDRYFEVDLNPGQVKAACRFWDTAATQAGGDWTVGTLVLLLTDGTYVIDDVVRGQWDPPHVDMVIRQTAAQDAFRFSSNHFVKIREEQEGGASGKTVINARAKSLAGFDYKGSSPQGDKESRAFPFAAQCGIKNVALRRARWNKAWLEELLLFPHAGGHDDQVDSASGGFNALHTAPSGFRRVKLNT